jgi:hypothetical protein
VTPLELRDPTERDAAAIAAFLDDVYERTLT